jgi:hypothetical protein
MRRIFKLFFVLLVLSLLVEERGHAGKADRVAFLSTKGEIQRLAVERIRSGGAFYERVIVAAVRLCQ